MKLLDQTLINVAAIVKKKKKITCLAVKEKAVTLKTSYGPGDWESTDVGDTKLKQNTCPQGNTFNLVGRRI